MRSFVKKTHFYVTMHFNFKMIILGIQTVSDFDYQPQTNEYCFQKF